MGVGTMGKTKTLILGTSALVALIASGANARAGSFAVREQSAWGEGSSYAGVAAGGSTSAMFWNPATMTQTGKMSVE
jgi:long-chain fatty acid transport protein